jgi:hypothetical protein
VALLVVPVTNLVSLDGRSDWLQVFTSKPFDLGL